MKIAVQRELDNVAIVVTGAGSGIGRALALEASRRGARLFLAGRRTEPLLETAQLAEGPSPIVISADVTRSPGRSLIRETVERTAGRLDMLINNAGLVISGPLSGASDESLEAMMRTNLLAPACLIRDLVPLLTRAPDPRIVNVGSMFGSIAFPLFAGYSATKFGLRGLSDALRRELSPMGIGVTYAAPRATRTPAADDYAHLIAPFRMAIDSPDGVARRVLDAAFAGRPNVYPAGPERLLMLVQHLLPEMFNNAVARMLQRAMAAMPNPR